MQLVHTQQLLAQTDIAMHLVHVLVNCLDQVVVHGYGHIGAVQSGLPGRAVLPGLGEELQLLVLGVQQARGGVAHAVQSIVQILISALAQHPVAAFLQRYKSALAQGVGLSLTVHGIGIVHIRIDKGAVDRIRGVGHFPGRCQQTLLRGGQGMGLSAALIVQIPAVTLQVGASLVEALQSLLRDRHDLRSIEAERGTDAGQGAHELADHGLIGGVAGILIRLAGGVIRQQLHLAAHILYQMQKCAEGLAALAQLAGVSGNLVLSCHQCGKGLLPGLVGHIQVLQCPGIFLRDFLTGSNGFEIRHT